MAKEKVADAAVVGAGPAGLCAALELARGGGRVILLDENDRPGGQLFKQIHRFFGSKEHSAGVRGFTIGEELVGQCRAAGVEIMLDSVVWGVFPGHRLGVTRGRRETFSVRAGNLILCTGAQENPLSFPGWTLPGVMGAGAAQTMMNIHRVRPGAKALMIGSGNVGLIVSYQLMQAGCAVPAVVEAMPRIGGYLVHAQKIARMGVELLTSHTILEARGKECVAEAVVAKLDRKFRPLPGTERTFEVDLVCLAVGLRPLSELAWLAGCRFGYLPALGGFVTLHDENMETTVPGIYVAGDLTGIEEASTAMEEGKLAGAACLEKLGRLGSAGARERKKEIAGNLRMLRRGPFGDLRHSLKQEIHAQHSLR